MKLKAPQPKGETPNATEWRFFRSGAGQPFREIAAESPTEQSPRPRVHSATNVGIVIRGLENLSETLPAVLQVANGVAPQGIRYASHDTLVTAIDMLTSYRDHRASREMESDGKMIAEALAKATSEGIALGIEQEKWRVKEARRGRK